MERTVKSLPWMESVDAKLARAHEHLETLQREITEFIEQTKHNIVIKTDIKHNKTSLVYWTDAEHPPIRLSVVVGDCIFNMRCALDHLVCGLIRTKDPTSRCSRVRFPIYKTQADCDNNCATDLKNVPEDAVRAIKQLQPYRRPADVIAIDPLVILNTLSNRDKHRAVNLTLSYSKDTRFRVRASDGQVYTFQIKSPMFTAFPHHLDLPIPVHILNGEIPVTAEGTSVVTFREVDPWSERSVHQVLVTCLMFVENQVVARLKPFFR